MPVRVCYLFGAGASSQVLPMSGDLGARLLNQADWIWKAAINTGQGELLKGVPASDWQSAIQRYANCLKALADKASHHESVDTYAKKLFFRRDGASQEALYDLKVCLSAFFALEQRRVERPDSRYDGFLSSVMVEGGGLPAISEEVLALTWNYDNQFALAYQQFVPELKLSNVHEQIQHSTLEYVESRRKNPRVVQLNGMAGWGDVFGPYPVLNDSILKIPLSIDQAMTYTASCWWNQSFRSGARESRPSLIRFAWEKGEVIDLGVKRIQSLLQGCESLVVIGYSFPFFNRDVDRAIIGNMPSLKKVYIQSTPAGARNAASAFRAITLKSPADVELYESTDKFLLPPEL